MYEINECSPYSNTINQGDYNVQIIRLIMVSALLFLTLMYYVISLVLRK